MRVEYDTKIGFTVGVDLGQAQDFTAITVIDRFDHVVKYEMDGTKVTKNYQIRHIQRVRLGTSYPDIVAMVGTMIKALPTNRKRRPSLIVDATGVGRPVIDLMKKSGLRPVAVSITGGINTTSAGDFAYNVPKRALVSSLQIALQSGRLKIAKRLPEAELLVNELLNFKVRISSAGHDSYEAWRESVHDDLVLSAACATWFNEQEKPAGYMARYSQIRGESGGIIALRGEI